MALTGILSKYIYNKANAKYFSTEPVKKIDNLRKDQFAFMKFFVDKNVDQIGALIFDMQNLF